MFMILEGSFSKRYDTTLRRDGSKTVISVVNLSTRSGERMSGRVGGSLGLLSLLVLVFAVLRFQIKISVSFNLPLDDFLQSICQDINFIVIARKTNGLKRAIFPVHRSP